MQGSLSLPISISYESGGIKVDQEPSTAGLSWHLNCSAAISRTVIGKPDESTSYYTTGLMYATSATTSFRDWLMEIESGTFNPLDTAYLRREYTQAAINAQAYYEGRADLANDIFHVSGCGLNAIVIFDYKNRVPTPYIYSSKGLRLYGYGASSQLTVFDDRGIRYAFGERERTRFTNTYGASADNQLEESVDYTSTWHLSEISNENGDTIKLHYRDCPLRYINYGTPQINHVSTQALSSRIPSRVSSIGTITYYPKVLCEAESRALRVKFHYRDYSSIDILERIEIYAKDAQNTLLRTINLRYGGDIQLSNVPSPLKKYLLTSIYDNNELAYRFEYYSYPEMVGAIDLNSADFGGYFNDADNSDPFPPVGVMYGGSADKSVNPRASLLFALKSIHYPTGGRTDFEWENHEIGFLNSARVCGIKDEIFFTTNRTYTICAITEPDCQNLSINNIVIGDYNQVTIDLTKYFLMNPQNLYLTEYYHEHTYEYHPRYPRLVIYDSKNRTDEYHTFYLDYNTIEDKYHNRPFAISLAPGTYSFALEDPMDVHGAESSLETEFLYCNNIAGRIYIDVKVSDRATSTYEKKQRWCGLRIKRIMSNALTDTIFQDFRYGDWNPSASTGVAKAYPMYDNKWYFLSWNPRTPGEEWAEITTVTPIGFPRSAVSEPQVQYRQTMMHLSTSLRDNSSDLAEHRIMRYFTTAADSACQNICNTPFYDFQPAASRMNTSMEFRRGLPTYEKVVLSGESPLSDIKYSYNIYQKEECPFFTTEPFVITDYASAPLSINGVKILYGIGKYQLIPHNVTVKSVEATSPSQRTYRTDFGYFYTGYTDSLDFALKRYQVTHTSSGNEVKTYYTYKNFANSYFTPDVETEISVTNGIISSGKRYHYITGSSLVDTVYGLSRHGVNATPFISNNQATTWSQASLLSKPTFCYSYDSCGRLIQISYRNVVLASYVWGYNGMYPIIEAQGISRQELEQAISTGEIESFLNNPSKSNPERIRELQNRIIALYPDNEISSVNYHWLFGVASITDSRGNSKQFGYDGRGRLNSVSDFNNFLTQRYEYSTYENWIE